MVNSTDGSKSLSKQSATRSIDLNVKKTVIRIAFNYSQSVKAKSEDLLWFGLILHNNTLVKLNTKTATKVNTHPNLRLELQ